MRGVMKRQGGARHDGRRRPRVALFGVAVVASLPASSLAGAAPDPGKHGELTIEVLSSAPEQVSGGDALVRVEVPRTVPLHQVTVTLDGADVTDAFSPVPGVRALVGLVEGLDVGANELRAAPNGRGRGRPAAATVTLVNHPINGPIFSGPQQQPFVCTTARATFDGRRLLGQPLVDNQTQFGIPVAAEAADGSYPSDGRGYPTAAATIVGWSKDCSATTRVTYAYKSTGGQFRHLADLASLPDDVATTTTLDGRTLPYVVRWELGTINRFVYSVAMLVPTSEADAARPDDSLWNGRLVFSLQGGVAIGHTQGTIESRARCCSSQCWDSATRSSTRRACARTPTTTCNSAVRRRSC